MRFWNLLKNLLAQRICKSCSNTKAIAQKSVNRENKKISYTLVSGSSKNKSGFSKGMPSLLCHRIDAEDKWRTISMRGMRSPVIGFSNSTRYYGKLQSISRNGGLRSFPPSRGPQRARCWRVGVESRGPQRARCWRVGVESRGPQRARCWRVGVESRGPRRACCWRVGAERKLHRTAARKFTALWEML
jgi:hypothetical protein